MPYLKSKYVLFTLGCEVFAGTKTTAYPQVKFHPDSFHVGFLGSGEVQLVTLENTGFHSKARDLTFRTYKHFDISPDGEWYVVMARNYSSGEYDLLLFSSKVVTNVENAVSLKKLNPEFKGLRSYNEHSYCKWSPDSCYIGVSIYSGAFMVLKRQKLTLIANIFPDIIPDSTLSICNTFDFNPRYGHQFVAIATSDRQLYVVDVDNGHIVSQSSEVCSDFTIDALKYTYNGNCVGVATQDFMIYLYDQDVSSVIYSLDMKVSCPGIQNPLTGSYQAITKLSFSMCGEQVMVATSDGLVRLWQLPPTINLQNICKLKILSYLPIGRVKMLPLPTDLIDYLLDIPVTSENIEMSGVVRNVDNSKDKKEQEESLTNDTTYKHFVLRETPKLISFKNVNTDLSKLKTVKW